MKQACQIKVNRGEQLFCDYYRDVALSRIKQLLEKRGVIHQVKIRGIRTSEEVKKLFQRKRVKYQMIPRRDGFQFTFYQNLK